MNKIDKIKSVETVIVDDFRGRQMKSFAYLGTTPNMWKMCRIIGRSKSGHLIFDIPPDYVFVQAYTMLNPPEKVIKEIGGGWMCLDPELSICELCGHKIKYVFPIQCDEKKFY